MQSTSKQALIDMLRFVESQTAFIIKTTVRISNYQDFLNSDDGMVLFNSTCMCLQTIGETIFLSLSRNTVETNYRNA